MESQSASAVKAYGVLPSLVDFESAQRSPDCGSCSIVSRTQACSSDCTNLLCTEDALDDCDMADAFGDEVQELCSGFPFDAGRRLRMEFTSYCANPLRVGELIRDDLHKQAEVRHYGRTTIGQGSRDPSAPLEDRDMGGAGGAGGGGVGSASCLLPASYRARMVGWMRQVSSALRLQLSTLFIATSILDRFVASSEELPSSGLLQLITLACMSVAVKYDEVRQYSPAIWLSLAVDERGRPLYGACDLQRCEFILLQTIDWQLHQPNTYTFLEHFFGIACSAMVSATTTTPIVQTAEGIRQLDDPAVWEASKSCKAAAAAETCSASHDAAKAEVKAAAAVSATEVPEVRVDSASRGLVAAAKEAVAATEAEATEESPNPYLADARTSVDARSCPSDHFLASLDKVAPAPPATTAAVIIGITAAAVQEAAITAAAAVLHTKALAFAEASRLFSIFSSYEPSTVALACLALAEHEMYGIATAAASVPFEARGWDTRISQFSQVAPVHATASAAAAAASAASDPTSEAWTVDCAAEAAAAAAVSSGGILAAVTAATKMPLASLAPDLAACASTLERCYELLTAGLAGTAPAAERSGGAEPRRASGSAA